MNDDPLNNAEVVKQVIAAQNREYRVRPPHAAPPDSLACRELSRRVLPPPLGRMPVPVCPAVVHGRHQYHSDRRAGGVDHLQRWV